VCKLLITFLGCVCTYRHTKLPNLNKSCVFFVFVPDGANEEDMRKKVRTLSVDLMDLSEKDSATKAFHLARRGTLFRKLGNIK